MYTSLKQPCLWFEGCAKKTPASIVRIREGAAGLGRRLLSVGIRDVLSAFHSESASVVRGDARSLPQRHDARRALPRRSASSAAHAPRPAHSAGRTRLEAWEDSRREAGPNDQTPSGSCSLNLPTTSSIRPNRTGALTPRGWPGNGAYCSPRYSLGPAGLSLDIPRPRRAAAPSPPSAPHPTTETVPLTRDRAPAHAVVPILRGRKGQDLSLAEVARHKVGAIERASARGGRHAA